MYWWTELYNGFILSDDDPLSCGIMSTFHWLKWSIAFIKRLRMYGEMKVIDTLNSEKARKLEKFACSPRKHWPVHQLGGGVPAGSLWFPEGRPSPSEQEACSGQETSGSAGWAGGLPCWWAPSNWSSGSVLWYCVFMILILTFKLCYTLLENIKIWVDLRDCNNMHINLQLNQ